MRHDYWDHNTENCSMLYVYIHDIVQISPYVLERALAIKGFYIKV